MKILIIDNHPLLLAAIKREIKDHKPQSRITLIKQLDIGMQAIRDQSFDLIIIEIGISGGNVQTIREIRETRGAVKILVFSALNELNYAQYAISSGANGFLSKESAVGELIIAVDTVLSSKTYFSDKIYDTLLSQVITNEDSSEFNPLNSLTPRERMVTHLLVQGINVADISKTLGLKASTVSTFKASIFKKLHVSNILALSRKVEILS